MTKHCPGAKAPEPVAWTPPTGLGDSALPQHQALYVWARPIMRHALGVGRMGVSRGDLAPGRHLGECGPRHTLNNKMEVSTYAHSLVYEWSMQWACMQRIFGHWVDSAHLNAAAFCAWGCLHHQSEDVACLTTQLAERYWGSLACFRSRLHNALVVVLSNFWLQSLSGGTGYASTHSRKGICARLGNLLYSCYCIIV